MSASQLPTARRSATAATRKAAGEENPAPGPGLQSPLVLGRYRLLRRLGAGAFGTVWMGHDERLDREVAVKIVARERIIGGRFEREARAAARLAHPGIVTLYEAAVDDEGAYLVSELVRGATLHALLDEGRLSDRDIVAISISLCDALSHAHAQGVVHRDVKPSNILVPERPSSHAHPAKLTDFGVARVIGGDSLTRTGDVIGTAAYMAPEQAEGREAGPPADLYALALVIYQALTGVNPVQTGVAATRARRLGAHLPPLRRQRRDLPRELGRSIDLALRPRARERGTLDELRGALLVSLDQVEDTPGIVTSPWPSAPGSQTATDALRDSFSPPESQVREPLPPRFAARAAAEAEPFQAPRRDWSSRGLGGVATALSTGWLATHLLARTPVPAAAAALLAAALVLVLPRVGWLSVNAALAGTALTQGRPGGALVVTIAALVPVALLPRRGTAWALSAGAPALGLVGLAGAWPAIAGRAWGNAWRRGALALTGWVWLALAGPLASANLYARRPAGIPAPDIWAGSLAVTLHDLLGPLVSSGILSGGLVWAAGAAVLPWLVRSRSLAINAVLACVWSAVLLGATEVAIAAAHGSGQLEAPRTAILGAIAAVIVALSPSLLALARAMYRPEGAQAELP
ncbi:MAG: protein kinase domain-containing protein [Solirubrobacteraceae bacterium]